MNVLKTQSLTIEFGGLRAVSSVDLEIPQGSIFGLIGPNGAGKTTFFNMITGVYLPTSGAIQAFGQDVVGLSPPDITRIGIARTFQNIRLFKNLTVLQNILISLDHFAGVQEFNLFATIFRTDAFLKNEEDKVKRALDLLKIFKLDSRADIKATNLPYGDQRRLEIVRALATGAKLLLLDEPAAGMNPQETARLMETIRELRDRLGVTILLIEHDMKLVMGVCERIAVLDYGIKIAEGTAKEIQSNERVVEAYLGKSKETLK